MKAFLFVFDQSRIERKIVVQMIDRMSEIENWYAFFGNTMCLASEAEGCALSRRIREALPDLNFIVTEVDADRKAGWLQKSVWSFLNDPQAAQAESA